MSSCAVQHRCGKYSTVNRKLHNKSTCDDLPRLCENETHSQLPSLYENDYHSQLEHTIQLVSILNENESHSQGICYFANEKHSHLDPKGYRQNAPHALAAQI